MKKLIYLISISIAFIALIVGCSGDSYQKRIDKEKKAIKGFLADNGVDILHEYPADHKFDLSKNQYYLEGSTGVYLQVVDPGDLTDVPKNDKNFRMTYLRFDSVHYMVSDYWAQGRRQEIVPITFEYQNTDTYGAGLGSANDQYYMSPALVLPVEKGIGNGAKVNIIVPFANGSYQQTSYYEPFNFVGLEYTFKQQHTGGEEEENIESKK